MWRTATSQLFPVTFICMFGRKWCGGPPQRGKKEKRVYNSKYTLWSIVYCFKCWDIYCKIAWNNWGKYSTVWRCCTRVEHGPKRYDAMTILGIEFAGCGGKGNPESIGRKGCILVCFGKERITFIYCGSNGRMLWHRIRRGMAGGRGLRKGEPFWRNM